MSLEKKGLRQILKVTDLTFVEPILQCQALTKSY